MVKGFAIWWINFETSISETIFAKIWTINMKYLSQNKFKFYIHICLLQKLSIWTSLTNCHLVKSYTFAKWRTFRLVQIESICRWQQKKCDKTIQICLGKGRKQLEKEEMLVTSIFSFSHNVFLKLLSQGH